MASIASVNDPRLYASTLTTEAFTELSSTIKEEAEKESEGSFVDTEDSGTELLLPVSKLNSDKIFQSNGNREKSPGRNKTTLSFLPQGSENAPESKSLMALIEQKPKDASARSKRRSHLKKLIVESLDELAAILKQQIIAEDSEDSSPKLQSSPKKTNSNNCSISTRSDMASIASVNDLRLYASMLTMEAFTELSSTIKEEAEKESEGSFVDTEDSGTELLLPVSKQNSDKNFQPNGNTEKSPGQNKIALSFLRQGGENAPETKSPMLLVKQEPENASALSDQCFYAEKLICKALKELTAMLKQQKSLSPRSISASSDSSLNPRSEFEKSDLKTFRISTKNDVAVSADVSILRLDPTRLILEAPNKLAAILQKENSGESGESSSLDTAKPDYARFEVMQLHNFQQSDDELKTSPESNFQDSVYEITNGLPSCDDLKLTMEEMFKFCKEAGRTQKEAILDQSLSKKF